jgi:uncharacterized protein
MSETPPSAPAADERQPAPVLDVSLAGTATTPPPPGAWRWSQVWQDVFFAHWQVSKQVLRRHVPAGLELDLTAGTAWVSAVAFRMCRARPRFLPAVGLVSDFFELNLRTYVQFAGRPGIYFLSMDAGKTLSVIVSRLLSPLPYQKARMAFESREGNYRFESVRPRRDGRPIAFSAAWSPGPELRPAPASSLDAWLTERYCLYAVAGRGRLVRALVDHQPWRLQRPRASIAVNSLGEPFGLELSRPPDAVHFSPGLEAKAWGFEGVG